MYDKHSVIYYGRAFFDIKNPQRLLQREVKGSHSHKSSRELGCDSQFPGFLYHMLTQKGHTHTHKPVFIKDGIRNELLKKK